MGYRVRAARGEDLPRLVDLNNAAYPAVPIVDSAELSALVRLCSLAAVVDDGGGPALGFLLALDPGADYASENYAWFQSRGSDSLYVDRIVIAEEARGNGLGPLLYDHVFDRARADGRAEVTCEVNLDPPNPRSLAFHTRIGFRQLGSQQTKGGAVTVALLAASVR